MAARRLAKCLNRRAGLAVVAGLSLAAAFPRPGWAGLAWIGPALVLAATLGAPAGRTFRLGCLAGLVQGLFSLWWLLYNPFPAGAVLGWLSLSAYVALYPAVWAWLCWRTFPEARGWAGPGLRRFRRVLPDRWRWMERYFGTEWTGRTAWMLGCAVFWVALEMARARLLTGFPWNCLGVSQYRVLPLVQIASSTGVYGVSFLVVWGSVALFCSGLKLWERALPLAPAPGTMGGVPSPTAPAGWPGFPAGGPLDSFRLALFTDLALPLAVVAAVAFDGVRKLAAAPTPGPELKAALVQPSIPQRLIFDAKETPYRFRTLLELSQLALASQPDLLIWPEASLPGMEPEHYQALTNLIASRKTWMIFGADDAEPKPGALEEYDFYNGAFLFGPDGRFRATYRKCHLVIFGEYVPLMDWLPFLKRLTPIASNFTPGRGPVPFVLDAPRARTSVLICFEDVVPHLVRRYVEPDTDFLLNLTNDGWFAESAAQWQHAANAAFRAVENGLPLVRCTNNGLTCWVDALGRFHDVGFRDPEDVYAAGFKVVRIPLRSGGPPRAPTLYSRSGDWFGWSCAGLGVLALARSKKWGQAIAPFVSGARSAAFRKAVGPHY